MAESQTEWAVYLKGMIRVNFRFFSQACFCFLSRSRAPKEVFQQASFFLISQGNCAKRTNFAVSKRFHFNQFSQEAKECHGHSVSKNVISPFCSHQFSSVAQLCPTLCDPINRSTPGLPVHHQLPEFTQTHVHRVSDAIQPSHPLSSPFPPAPNPSQHQNLFQ